MKLRATRGLVFQSASLLALAIAFAGAATAQTTRVDEPAPDSTAPAADSSGATPGKPAPTISPTSSASGNQAAGAPQDIVVTGTLLRGIAPVGTDVIGVSRKDIVATGALSSNDLLAKIPQVANFNSFPTAGAGFGQSVVSTNLRGLGASGGTTTLVLINGHRAVGSGILQTYVDPQIIPPAIIERVEVIPDGGSSIYGSDAIGGVINFITRKRMSGIDASAHYGFSNGYNTYDANLTVGKDWGSGGAFISYVHAWHNNLQGIERDYITNNASSHGGADRRVVTCSPTNIQIGSTYYPLPGRVAGAPNLCDPSDYADVYPREHRDAVYATLDQQLNSKLSMNITAYYSRRITDTTEATLSDSGTITSANPYFQPIGTETSQKVSYNFAPVFGNGINSPDRFDSWGVTPTFDYDLGGSWHLRALGNYGHSYNRTLEHALNTANDAAALAGTTTATALDPYDLTQTDPDVLASLLDYSNFAQSKQDLAEARLVADGHLFSLPGGDVRLAVGTEYHYEDIKADIRFGSAEDPFTNSASASRHAGSVYGELFVPVFGADNGFAGMRQLDLTASARYDHYNDVGGTTNPKIGFNYRPVEWITVRGNWGTSFHAPSLADTTGAVDARISFIPFTPNLAAGSPPSDATRPLIWISGGSASLKPETAHTWSLGTDIKPPVIPGLTLSATYYNIDFTNIISVNAGGFSQAGWYSDPANAAFFIRNPTIDQVNTFSGNLRSDNFPNLPFLYATYGTPYAVLDLRRYNLGRLKQDGIDFNVTYNHPTSFGSINASFGGTYTLHRRSSNTNNGIYVEQLDNGYSRFNFIATAGAQVGAVTGRATVTHSGGYPILGDPLQSTVGSFTTVDLFLSLDLEKFGLKGTQLTLNVNNVLNQDPPWYDAGSGYTNGSTLGRLFQFGVHTKF